MTATLNTHTLLWVVGVIQPANAKQIRVAMSQLISEVTEAPTLSLVKSAIDRQIELGHLIKIGDQDEFFVSLTYSGHKHLPTNLRKLRDKVRLLLLNKARRGKEYLSCEASSKESAGVAPAKDASTNLKVDAANKLVGLRTSGQQVYWPRLSQRFEKSTGPKPVSHDTVRFPYLSFSNEDQVREACGYTKRQPLFDFIGIGVCLGISPGLVQRIAFRPHRHYRSFKLPKKGGGKRTIDSPRVFLKTIQAFLADYVLSNLKIHDGVHSYRTGRSVVTNSILHQGKEYVCSLDIQNFFGSIENSMVQKLLISNNFSTLEAEVIAEICTKGNALPQGAPTSPILSNALLLSFDAWADQMCSRRSLAYSRYADDIAISGNSGDEILDLAIKIDAALFKRYGLHLNASKTRIANARGRQVVTGVVVNDEAAPPREFRRRVRAMVNNAFIRGTLNLEEYQLIQGHLNYIRSFPKYRSSDEIAKSLRKIESLKRAAIKDGRFDPENAKVKLTVRRRAK